MVWVVASVALAAAMNSSRVPGAAGASRITKKREWTYAHGTLATHAPGTRDPLGGRFGEDRGMLSTGDARAIATARSSV